MKFSDILWLIIIAAIVGGGWYFYMARKIAERLKAERIALINSHREQWGNQMCDLVIAKQVTTDMTKEMVELSWGKPDRMDEHEITKAATKIRWVFGTPRQGAHYVWFKNDKVVKIKA